METLREGIYDLVRLFAETDGKYNVDELTDRIMELIESKRNVQEYKTLERGKKAIMKIFNEQNKKLDKIIKLLVIMDNTLHTT